MSNKELKTKKCLTLILDNYDSFTYNLYQYLGEISENVLIKKNDEINLEEIKKINPTHIIISPGPGSPENKKDFGVCKEVIEIMGRTTPLLGVCLGHQGIVLNFGGKIEHVKKIMHGKTSIIEHNNKGIFKEIKKPLEVMRYHSLIAQKNRIPTCLEITAWTKDHLIMGVQHKHFPIFGVQFHPESIGTSEGKNILRNFLTI